MESEHKISRFLDWIGFVPEEIRWRRQVWRDANTIRNIGHSIIESEPAYITGSRPEGIGVNALDSDHDIMYQSQHVHVIHVFKDWKQRRGVNMLMADTQNVHPGYCKLSLMNTIKPALVENRNNIHLMPYVNHNGLYVLPNTVDGKLRNTVRNGPADTKSHEISDIDMVHCITTTFPPCATEWIERNRPGQFPSMEFIRESSRRDVFVVPTGYKNSEHPDLEWRFSFSLIELDIVLMWPDNVTRCYVLLKMLMKHISSVSPHLSGIISSYHVKTVLFWLTEETGLSFWDSSSLGKCLVFSLMRMLFLIEQGYIPHYFIKDNNLFDLHTGSTRQRDVATALRAMISEGPACVFRCEYYKNLSVDMNLAPITYKSHHVVVERFLLYINFADHVISSCKIDFSSDMNESITSLCKALDIVHGAISNYDNDADSDVIKSLDWMRANFKCTLATSILSIPLKHSVSNTLSYCLFKLSEQLLKTSVQQHIGLLKIANFYYQTKQHTLATNVLRILYWMEPCRLVMLAGGVYSRMNCSGFVGLQDMSQMYDFSDTESPTDILSNKLLISLRFELPEIHAAPYALKFEIFQPEFGLAEEKDEPYYPNTCFVNPVAFVHYLSYLCYEDMGRRGKAQEAFDKLQSVAKQDRRIHRATTWNLVGHCYFKQVMPGCELSGQVSKDTTCPFGGATASSVSNKKGVCRKQCFSGLSKHWLVD